MPTLSALLVLLFPMGVIAAGVMDVTTYTIPNRLSAGLALAFLSAALACGLSPATLGLCLLVGLAGLIVGVALFAFRVIGGGDAKLMAACLLWLGPAGAPTFLVWTAAAGGALALALLAARRSVSRFAFAPAGWLTAGDGGTGESWIGRLLRPDADVPYGVAIAAGALMALPMAPVARALRVF